MSTSATPLISVVLPVHNEQAGLTHFHAELQTCLQALTQYRFEVLYCDDGSRDGSSAVLQQLAADDKQVRVITLTRNFGKEIATTAGIERARGDAVIMLDSDGQHPIELIPKFLKRWQDGAKVVIGVRTGYQSESWVKRTASRLFYYGFNKLTNLSLQPGATDFRLIDKQVQTEFVRLTERNRIARGLIDWLGYQQATISFTAKPRLHDTAAYSYRKLWKLAIDSVISLSNKPLYATALLGALILPVSALLGAVMVIDKLAGDPLSWHTTGTAFVSVLLLFLVGVLLMSQGILGLYLSHIHSETQNRPLYVIDHEASRRL